MTAPSDETQRWERETLDKALRRSPERKDEFTTSSGTPVKRLYTADDLPADFAAELGYPGEYPYTRGVQPSMYRSRFWTRPR